MKAICLVKQVPALGAIEFDEETKSLKREGVPLELNAFDRYAVQYGALLAEETVAMTMGPPQAEEALRECMALGADRAIHLSDRVFAVADTIGTSQDARARRPQGRSRSRPLRAQGARLGDLAGAGTGRRLPRLAARDERRGDRALRRTRCA